MNKLLQNRHKEKLPLNTVQTIRDILHGLGICTIEKWTDSKVSGCHSLRVEIAGTKIGQNGKGSTPEFALASAYAEFMERLQNDIMYIGDYDEKVWNHCGFYYTPDERLMSIEELSNDNNLWLDILLERFRKKDDEITAKRSTLESIATKLFASRESRDERQEALKLWSFSTPKGCNHDIVSIPFYSLKTGKLNYIPVSVLRAVYGSNGTCAGNSKEEALVQGLSELFERHSNVRILNERLTPPTIPNEYLRKFERVYEIIKSIESRENYRLIVKDCSLGSGFPVIASVLINMDTQTYVVKFGAHPVFEIALERTLTEMFQGRDIFSAATVSKISEGFEHIGNPDNLHNVLKVAAGQYPEQFFSDNYSYEFEAFDDNSDKSNGELLKFTTSKLLDKGYDIMIRDVSYLGFCSFQIIVPGYSEVFDFGTQRLKEKKSQDQVKEIIRRLPEASKSDIEKLVVFMSYKRNWILENSVEFYSALPLRLDYPGGEMASEFLLATCYYRLGRVNEAYRGFKYVAEYMKLKNNAEASYYACLRDYCGAVSRGMSKQEIADFLYKFYGDDLIKRVVSQVSEPNEILNKLYKSINCFDCDACSMRSRCFYEVIKNVKLKIKEKNLEYPIDQKMIGTLFNS